MWAYILADSTFAHLVELWVNLDFNSTLKRKLEIENNNNNHKIVKLQRNEI